MTAALPAFPGSRVIAGWWRQLAPWRPRRLWAAHLDIDRIEALVCLRRQQPLDRFTALVLGAMVHQAPATLERLDRQLGLSRSLLAQILHGLEAAGLAATDASGRWSTTPAAAAALAAKAFQGLRRTRCWFHFLRDEAPPRFIDLSAEYSTPRPVVKTQTDAQALLEKCVAQPADWKERRHFPLEIESLAAEGPEWERVIVVHPEAVMTAVALTDGDSGGRLLGFAVQPETWKLDAARPAFALGADWQETFPSLGEPSAPEWLEAWTTWCQPRLVPRAEAEACRLERQEWRLRVWPGRALADRLRAARSEALKGEAWLLAGHGRQRLAAQIEIAEIAR